MPRDEKLEYLKVALIVFGVILVLVGTVCKGRSLGKRC